MNKESQLNIESDVTFKKSVNSGQFFIYDIIQTSNYQINIDIVN